MEAFLAYVTAASATEAERIGRALVEERLASCANVLDGMRSVYRWEGRVESAREAVLLLKTTGDRLDELIARTRQLHAYACPCIVAVPIVAGNPDFLRWIDEQTRP